MILANWQAVRETKAWMVMETGRQGHSQGNAGGTFMGSRVGELA